MIVVVVVAVCGEGGVAYGGEGGGWVVVVCCCITVVAVVMLLSVQVLMAKLYLAPRIPGGIPAILPGRQGFLGDSWNSHQEDQESW